MTDEAQQITPQRAVSILDHAARRADSLYRTIIRQRRIVAGQNKDLEKEPPPTKRDWFGAERDAVTIRDGLSQLAFLIAGRDLDEQQPEFGMPPSAEYSHGIESSETEDGSTKQVMPIMPIDDSFEDAIRRQIEVGDDTPFDWEGVRAHHRLREANVHQMLRDLQRHVKSDANLDEGQCKDYDNRIEDILRYIRGEEG